MAYRLRNPTTGATFSVSSTRRRDRFLRRGFALAGEPEAAPESTPLSSLSYRELQANAKALGIPGNQTRDDLERAIADHKG